MDMGAISENSVVSGSDGGRSAVNLNYILYIGGFFTIITAIVGVALAYANRATATGIYRSHFEWQIKIFWRGIIFMAANTLLYLLISGIAVATLGVGVVLYIVPVGIGLWWMIWTIMAIAQGMQKLGRQEAISPV